MADNREEIRAWLKTELAKAGRGAKVKLAAYLDLRPDHITRMLADEPGKETRDVKAIELMKMSEFFKSPPPGVAALNDNASVTSTVRPVSAAMQPVVSSGIAGAGKWREFDDFDQSEKQVVWEAADPDFPDARLLSFDVDGDSMNELRPRPILHGDRVVGVAYEDVERQVPLRDGMVVVVQRIRDGGHIIEFSVKQVEFYRDRVEFHPRSNNPKHKPIVVKHEDDRDDGITVSVVAWVRRISNDIR